MASKEVSDDAADPVLDKAKRLHNKLLYTTIAIDYLHSSVGEGIPEQQFRANFRNFVTDPLSHNAENVSRLIEILEEKGFVSLGDYDNLIEIVNFNVKIVEEVEDTKAVLHTLGIKLYRRSGNDNRKKPIADYLYHCKYAMRSSVIF